VGFAVACPRRQAPDKAGQLRIEAAVLDSDSLTKA
jgi:hypothetical protein